jgi:hypothetical protein
MAIASQEKKDAMRLVSRRSLSWSADDRLIFHHISLFFLLSVCNYGFLDYILLIPVLFRFTFRR